MCFTEVSVSPGDTKPISMTACDSSGYLTLFRLYFGLIQLWSANTAQKGITRTCRFQRGQINR